MIRIIAKKDFTRNGEPIFIGDDVKVNLKPSPKGEANTAKSRRFLGKEAAALLWRTRAQHIYYTTFTMCYSILIMHKYCI